MEHGITQAWRRSWEAQCRYKSTYLGPPKASLTWWDTPCICKLVDTDLKWSRSTVITWIWSFVSQHTLYYLHYCPYWKARMLAYEKDDSLSFGCYSLAFICIIITIISTKLNTSLQKYVYTSTLRSFKWFQKHKY